MSRSFRSPSPQTGGPLPQLPQPAQTRRRAGQARMVWQLAKRHLPHHRLPVLRRARSHYSPAAAATAPVSSGPGASPTPEIGFKAARLAAALRAGLPVLPGWVVPVGEGESAMGAGAAAVRANGVGAGRVAVLGLALDAGACCGADLGRGWAGGAGDCAVVQSAGGGCAVGGGVFLGDGGRAGGCGGGGPELLGFGVRGGSVAAAGGVRAGAGGAGTGRAGAAGDRSRGGGRGAGAGWRGDRGGGPGASGGAAFRVGGGRAGR